LPLLTTKSDIAWDGETIFGVVEEYRARKMGLLDNPRALFHAINTGSLPFKRVALKHNKVTNYALGYIPQILTNTAPFPLQLPSQMELGTGSGTPARTDTDLWSPAAATLKPLSAMQVYLQYYMQYICTWQTSDPIQGTWTELGLKDAGGNLWAHAASTITINTGEMLVGQWQIQMVPS
jgi:hypothetical protein